MNDLIYGFSLDDWNSFSAEEQDYLQDKYEYELQHPEQAEWIVDHYFDS